MGETLRAYWEVRSRKNAVKGLWFFGGWNSQRGPGSEKRVAAARPEKGYGQAGKGSSALKDEPEHNP